jgi:DNA sulfur modification protein DndB
MPTKGKGKDVVKLPFTPVKQGSRTLYLTAMPAALLVKVSYAAVRRTSQEKGAVQRPLNENRITKIRDFALNGGDFPACIILNWVKSDLLKLIGGSLHVTVEEDSAQLIDGQHRVAGLEDAILSRREAVADMEIPVAIYRDLSTQECADIFLSINTEQKPVPKSLAYDLFGIASSHLVDPAAVRAADIAQYLSEEEDSPYWRLVKYSGESAKPGVGKLGVALSTFVNALKPLVAPNGVFETYKVSDLRNQTKAIVAFFKVLQEWYGEDWLQRDNAFMHAAGITGGLDFFKAHLAPYCNSKKSYSTATMRAAMKLDPKNRISKKEAERLGGRAMARTVKDLLVGRFIPAPAAEDDIEFDS